jgi:hypothetical protein
VTTSGFLRINERSTRSNKDGIGYTLKIQGCRGVLTDNKTIWNKQSSSDFVLSPTVEPKIILRPQNSFDTGHLALTASLGLVA